MGPAKVKVDINYLAMKLKMSSATVSKALNDRPDVSEATKKKVISFARKLNYVPDRFARSLRLKKSSLIGVIMHEMKHEFFVEIARSVTREAQKNGYQAVFASSEGATEHEKTIIDDFISRYIEGLLIFPCAGSDLSRVRELNTLEIPFVTVDNRLPELNAPFVGTDFAEGGYLGTKYLIEHRHKNIALMLGQKELNSTPERLSGYRRALQEYSLPAREQYVCYLPEYVNSETYTAETSRQQAENLLKIFPEITAFFCANADLAEGAAKGIMNSGKKLPDDISLMDFGGSRFTSLNQKSGKIGELAVHSLFNLINGKKTAEKTLVKPEIVDRHSVINLKP